MAFKTLLLDETGQKQTTQLSNIVTKLQNIADVLGAKVIPVTKGGTGASTAGLAQLGYATQQQFSDLRYENARDKCEIINSSHADKDAILAWLTNDKISTLQEKLQTAQTEISQRNQTETLIAAMRNGMCCPQTVSVPVNYGSSCGGNSCCAAYNAYARGGQQNPLWVNNTPQTA